jgi:hypothetical protein
MKTEPRQDTPRTELETVLSRVLPLESLSRWRPRGKCDWTPQALCLTALAWALSVEATLGDRFAAAKTWAENWLGQELPATIQGFHKALARYQDLLLILVREQLQQSIIDFGGRTFRTAGLAPLAVDGTRIDTPRSAANEQRFRAGIQQRRGKKRTLKQQIHADVRPQIWLTLVWHTALRLPWSWRLGPYGSSERAHLLDLLDELPSRTLLIGDAGFTGYDFWQAVRAEQHELLVRVGRNVKLLSKLACVRTRGDLVFLWPDQARRRSQPPLVLRQVQLTRKGRTILLVTSLRDEQTLTSSQLAELYRQRWGIEVFHRSLKQTFGRGKLRSTSPDHAVSELAWSLVALAGVQLVAVEVLRDARRYRQRSSTAQALREVRRTFWPAGVAGELPPLRARLLTAVHDRYRRGRKTRRRYPQKKRGKPTGIAQITPATRAQQLAATPYLVALLA